MTQTRERDARFALLCAGVLGLFAAHVAILVCLTEDAFITYRFAANWVAGHGLVWNPGEAPVEGYTNFAWLLVCAALLILGIDLPIATQALGVCASVYTLVVVWRMARRLGATSQQALLPCLALACSGPFAAWSTSGMETSLFALLVTLALERAGRFVESDAAEARARAYDVTGILLLATLTRPEGALVAAVLASVTLGLLGRRGLRATHRGPLFVAALAYLGVMALYTAWRLHTFGHPLPNTFYAKTGGGLEQAARGAAYVGGFALQFGVPWLFGLGVTWGAGRSRMGEVLRQPSIALATALVLAYAAYIAAVGGDYMAMYRFFVPVLPAFYLLVSAFIVQALRGGALRNIALLKAAALVGLAGTAFHSTPYEARVFDKPEHRHGNRRGIELERWYVARQQLIGRFFARYGRPGESLATGAIGAVAYESGLVVYDVHGIVDPHIAHHGEAREALGTGLPGHEKTDYAYIFDKQPTFYMFSRKLRSTPLGGIPQLVPEVDERVAREYKVGSVFLQDRVNGQSGYFSFLERRDRTAARPGGAAKPR